MAAPILAGAAAIPAATLSQFEAHLAAHDSATAALQAWCHARGIGEGPIRAHLVGAEAGDPRADIRGILGLGADDPLAMRNVRLTCDDKVLSIAWNWYAPALLTAEMNAALAGSDVPFGRVVAQLVFRRETIERVAGRAETCPEGTVSTHRALLRLPDGRPLAYLVECYTAAALTD